MSNIDRTRDGVFRDLDPVVFDSSAFVNFINGLHSSTFNDGSFVNMIKGFETSLLINDNFMGALSRRRRRSWQW